MTSTKNITQAAGYLAKALALLATTEVAAQRASSGSAVASRNSFGGALAKGQKRDPKVIEKVTSTLLAHIRKNPGQRIEPIGKALGLPTKDLLVPVKRLVGSKQVKTRGQRRATTYFAR